MDTRSSPRLGGAVVAAPTVRALSAARDSRAQEGAAAPPAGQSALDAMQARPRIVVTVRPGSRVVSSPLDVYVEITNLSDKDLTIQRIRLELPGELNAARGEASDDKERVTSPSLLMNPGHQRLFVFNLPLREAGWLQSLANPHLLTFVPGQYPLRVVVTFHVPPATDNDLSETATLTLEPPLSSLAWGGAAGSILLALFIGTYRLVRHTAGRRLLLLAEMSLLAVAGAVCALIFVILLRRLQGVDLPVNATVADFYGGIVIGLCSFKIGDWLYAKLFGDTRLADAHRAGRREDNQTAEAARTPPAKV